jgi:hypothetical protein
MGRHREPETHAKGFAYVLLVQRTRNHPSNFDNPQTRAFLQAAVSP